MNESAAMSSASRIIQNGQSIENPSIRAWKCFRSGKDIAIIWDEPESPIENINSLNTGREDNVMFGETIDFYTDKCFDLANSMGWEIDYPIEGPHHGSVASSVVSTFSILENEDTKE